MHLVKRIAVLMIVGLLMWAGCNRHQINLKNMTPEEQFEHAKMLFDKGDYYNSKLEFTVIVMNNPGHVIIEQTQFYLAESHFYEKEYILAIEEYEKLIRSIPQSQLVDDARYKIGLSYALLAPSYHHDQEYTRKAIMQFRTFMEEYPNSDLMPEVEKEMAKAVDKLAMKEFKAGELYRKMGRHRAALISFQAVLDEFPGTSYATEALFWKAECHRIMGSLEDAESTYLEFIKNYKDHELAGKAESRLKEIRNILDKYTIK